MSKDVSMKKVFVVFHSLSSEWYHEYVSKVRRTEVNHCGIMIELPDGYLLYYHCSPHSKWRKTEAMRFFKRYVPLSTFYIGTTSVLLKNLTSFADDGYCFPPWKLIAWHFVGRFIFPWWKPKGCGSFTCNILRSAGFNINNHVAPEMLLKELRDEHNYDEWIGESWKDLVS
jgi:hypothetical protein